MFGNKSFLRGDETMDYDIGDSSEHLVSKSVIGIAHFTEARSVKEHGFGRFESARVEVAVIGGKKPGPAENVAGANDLNLLARALQIRFNGNFTFDNQIKAVGRIAFAKNRFVGFKMGAHRALSQGVPLFQI